MRKILLGLAGILFLLSDEIASAQNSAPCAAPQWEEVSGIGWKMRFPWRTWTNSGTAKNFVSTEVSDIGRPGFDCNMYSVTVQEYAPNNPNQEEYFKYIADVYAATRGWTVVRNERGSRFGLASLTITYRYVVPNFAGERAVITGRTFFVVRGTRVYGVSARWAGTGEMPAEATRVVQSFQLN